MSRCAISVVLLVFSLLSAGTVIGQPELNSVTIKEAVELDVPLVKQRRMLCGPSVIEMLFRYWGVSTYSQEDIAVQILRSFPDVPRVKHSGLLEGTTIDLGKYPGTGTSVMRKFLRKFAKTYNSYLEVLPSDESEFLRKRTHHFAKLKKNLSNGVPVIVHQQSPRNRKRGHYLLAIGYDERSQEVILNDPAPGKKVRQSYATFLELWNVDKPWLHFNAIAFNYTKEPLHVTFLNK